MPRRKKPEEVVESPQTLALRELVSTLETYSHRRAAVDFLTFVRIFGPMLVSDFKMGRHIKVLCHKLQEAHEEGNKRLMFFLPPRSTKSVITSKLFPAWYTGNNPNHETLSISHSDQLASDFGAAVRDIVKDEVFQKIFLGVRLRKDAKAAGKWRTNRNGAYYAAGVHGQIAGRGAHIALLDDAMSEEDAFSPSGRRYIKEWYPAGLRSRLMPNGSVIIVNTRYHNDDLCGWLLKLESEHDDPDLEPWDVVSIPAWLDEDSAELLGLPVGSSYFPEWKPEKVLRRDEAEIRAASGERYWNSLYLQNPTPEEGGIIKRKYFMEWEYEEPPAVNFVLMTMDTAFSTATTADYSVIQTWGVFDTGEEYEDGEETTASNIILLSMVRNRFEYPDLRRKAKELYLKHQPDVCVIEKKASGQSLIQDLRRGSIPVLEYTPDKDKISRVYASTPLMESGRVWVPKGKAYSESLIEEAITFPFSKHDDQVDAMTMAILYIKESWKVGHPDDNNYDEDESDFKPRKKAYWR